MKVNTVPTSATVHDPTKTLPTKPGRPPVVRLHPDFAHRDRPGQRGHADPDRIGGPKAAGILAPAPERMKCVAHVTDRDAVPETVPDRSEAVDAVPDVL